MKYSKKIILLICCVLPLFLAGCTPRVTIIEPVNGDTFEAGEKIVFKGQATDPLHPNLADEAFVWTSDKDGKIGTGASIESSDLSEGEHTITLTVKDPNGQIGQSSVSITIGIDGVPTTTTTIENTPTTTTTIAAETTTTSVSSTTTTAITQRFTDNNNGTVTDTRTGLIWLKNANPCGLKTWYDAGTYCASLTNGQAGLTDGSTAGQWRLPGLYELEGIITDPPVTWDSYYPPVSVIIPGAPFTDVHYSIYWTSWEVTDDRAYYVDMTKGWVDACVMSSSCGYVWPVRDGNSTTTTTISPTTTTTTASGQRFTDNNNGTVTDTRTGLIWLKNANADAPNNSGYKTWADAVAYCNNLASGTAGLTDGSTAGQWRLPSVEELEGIGTDPPTTYCLDGSCPVFENPPSTITWTMPGTPFTNVQSYDYWSGTSCADDFTGFAWKVTMYSGSVYGSGKSDNYVYVWPVRDGN